MDFIDGILNFFDIIGVHATLWGPVLGVMLLWTLAILCVPMCIAGIVIGIKFFGRYRRRGTLFIIGSVIAIPLCVFYISWLINADIHVGFVRPPSVYEETAIEILEQDVDDNGFTADGDRYEKLEYAYSDLCTYMVETEPVFYCRDANSPENKNYGFNYYRLKDCDGLELYTEGRYSGDYLICRADQKEQVLAHLTDPDNYKWYVNVGYDRGVEISDELVKEIEAGYAAIDQSNSIKLKNPRTESLYLEQISSGILLVNRGIEMERRWGKLYYNITNYGTLEDPYVMELVPLPEELAEKLETVLGEEN